MMEWVGFVIFAVFLWSWSHRYLGESFTPEIAVQFFVALGLLLRPTRQMGEQVARLGETIGGLKASMGVLQEIDRLVKVEPAPASKVSSDALGQDDIQIERIECCYDGRLTFAASDLNLRLGKAVAIVGASGAGKSTFLKSIAGLIEPAVWRASCSWPTAVRRTAFVSQTPFLFHDSIRNNLVYGLEREILQQTTDEMLYASLSIVKLDTFVRGLPLGLQTTFHPVAHNFSGGQIQRLVIARALLRRRPILLLDEATSAIDGATEKHITEVLVSTVHETRTSLFSVTHRLTWLALFDEVWFIKDGTVALKGPHIQLMESHSDYRSFVTSENAKKEAT